MGPSLDCPGSGRTELALSLFGAEAPPDQEGTPRRSRPPHCTERTNADAIHAGGAYVSEDRLTLGLILDRVGLPVTANIAPDYAEAPRRRVRPDRHARATPNPRCAPGR